MNCKTKGCTNPTKGGRPYCNLHQCQNYAKTAGERCKNKKIKGRDFCIIHGRTRKENFGIFLSIFAILIAIFGHPFYYWVFGELIIDFKEDSVSTIDGNPVVKIELLNKLGHELSKIRGTASLQCDTCGYGCVVNESFKLEGGRDILAHGGKSELLLSPSPFLVNLIEEKNIGCSDAYMQITKFENFNKTHAITKGIYIFEFFSEDNGIKSIRKNYNLSNEIVFHSCVECAIIININSSDKKKYSHKEVHEFVGGNITIVPGDKFTLIPKEFKPPLYNSHYGMYFGSANTKKLCPNLTHSECSVYLCNKIKEDHEVSIDCEGEGIEFRYPQENPFQDLLLLPPI